ncbi:hypothetical protein H6F93_20030 [Leptolyngbya sp. FACHB-671]|uniref:hypothetical protein n=1 Tax=Leptolyngbya sp. FACHB-671 TaxID=2692812 RepID=UPI00168635E3|nr:hypothetical protein [Leptolyngbya sp. FACHB-671]MBD2069773.1 hypothetical protein [Leptolyngbya sp. FACHB-671]
MNPKNILLLSGASVALLVPPAIANQPTESIPNSSPAIETDLQTPGSIVVEVQVAQPEQIVEAVEEIAPVAPVPSVSPPEPFAPDFSAPAPEAIAPTSPEPLETEIESIPVAARADEIVASPSEEPLELDEKLDKSVAAVAEASPISPAASSEPIELIETVEETESTEELDEPTENPSFEAIAPNAEFPNEHSENLPVESPSESSNQSDHESDRELFNESLNQSENEWTENSPRLYGASEAEVNLIERLAQDDLDHWTSDEWIDLLLSEDDLTEEVPGDGDDLSTDPAVPESNQETELSQTQLEAAQPDLPRDVTLDSDPHLPESDAPQTLNPASTASASANTNSIDNNLDTSFANEAETAPRYRLVVDDRVILNVEPYRFDWKPSYNSDSIRKQKLRGRSPAVSPTSQTAISAGIGFNLRVSNRAQLQFAYGAQHANELEPKSKPSPSVQPATETPISAQGVKVGLTRADQPIKTNNLIEKTEKADLVERIKPVEGSSPVRETTSSSTSTNQSTNPVKEIQFVPLKTEKTNVASELSKPAFSFNRSFEWRIAPTVVLNTWGGLTVNPLPPESPILSLTYLFYLGFPDPLDQEGDRLVFMAGQPSRSTDDRE